MHGPINIIQQIQSLTDQLIAILKVSLLDFVLSSGVEVVGIRCTRIDVLHHREHIHNVVFLERWLVLAFEIVFSQ